MTDSESMNFSKATVDADGVAHNTYDWSATPPSTGIAETIAAAAGSDATAVAPLHDSIDAGALDSLLRSSKHRSDAVKADEHKDLAISLVHAGHEVTVRSGGSVTARPMESEPKTE